jgi:hypothetical protein
MYQITKPKIKINKTNQILVALKTITTIAKTIAITKRIIVIR